jgi:predicted NBD/HSP70 family sugar kinase
LNDVSFFAKGSGPLESRIAIPAVISRVKNEVTNGCSSCILELAQGNAENINLGLISEAVKLKDPYITGVMWDISKELSLAVSNICALLDLELILLGGELMDVGYDFLGPINTIANRLTPLGTKVAYSSLGHNAVIYGTFAIALEYISRKILEL